MRLRVSMLKVTQLGNVYVASSAVQFICIQQMVVPFAADTSAWLGHVCAWVAGR